MDRHAPFATARTVGFSLLFLVVLGIVAGCTTNPVGEAFFFQEPANAFHLPSPEQPYPYPVDQDFTKETQEDLHLPQKITAMSLKAEASLPHPTSYARVLLIDEEGKAYLVYDASFPFEHQEVLEDACMETCRFEAPLQAETIRIEISPDASLHLDELSYLTEHQSFYPEATITAIREAQQSFLIDLLSSRGLTWTPTPSEPCWLPYQNKQALFGDYKNTCYLECYSGQGVFEFCQDHPELVEQTKMTTDTVVFDWRDRHEARHPNSSYYDPAPEGLPADGWLTPVKNQGACGSCAAHAVTSALEGVINLYANQHLNQDLSEQDLISCGPARCSGGLPYTLLQHIQSTGVANETQFPYVQTEVPCSLDPSAPRWTLSGFTQIPSFQKNKAYTIKKALVETGPLVMSGPSEMWDHSIALTGHGHDANGAYWIIKNSWGQAYGTEGYGKIRLTPDQLRMTEFITLDVPLPPPGYALTKACQDQDLDGYCNWGLYDKPANCPASCQDNTIADCNDATPDITECSEETLLCGSHDLLYGAEQEGFGSYYTGQDLSCCGDDPDEYSDGTACYRNPYTQVASGINYPPEKVVEMFNVSFGATAFFSAQTGLAGTPNTPCYDCVLSWEKDGVAQETITGEYATSWESFDEHTVTLHATSSKGYSNHTQSVLVGVHPITKQETVAAYPAVFATRVVWQDDRHGNQDVFLCDHLLDGNPGGCLGGDEKTRLTTNPADQTLPVGYGNRVVWVDERNGNKDLYTTTISLPQAEPLVTNPADQDNPSMYGERVVWEDHRGTTPQIYLHNVSSGTTRQLYPTNSTQQKPAIYQDLVVWQDDAQGNYDIIAYNLTSDTLIEITSHPASQTNPSLFSSFIVWQDNRNGNDDIYGFDGETEQVISSNEAPQRFPHIYDNLVVWQDLRNKQDLDNNWDVYLYDLATQTVYPLTNNDQVQGAPAVGPERVVWMDSRNGYGNYDLYEASLPASFITPADCSDGTPSGSCNGFTYCDEGVLVPNDCQHCGCPSGAICENVAGSWECVPAASCDEETLSGKCNGIWYCNNGIYEQGHCDLCGCEPSQVCTLTGYCENAVATSIINPPSTIAIEPVLGEDVVVYVDSTGFTKQLKAYTPSTNTTQTLATSSKAFTQKDVHGSVVVWSEHDGIQRDIYAYHIDTGTETRITNTPTPSYQVATDGDHVVWREGDDENTDQILLCQFSLNGIQGGCLETDQHILVADQPGAQRNPTVSPAMVVWQDNRSGQEDLYAYNLTTGATTLLVGAAGNQTRPDIDNLTMVWEDNREGTIQIYALEKLTEPQRLSPKPFDQTSPWIHGSLVVWQERYQGDFDQDWDIYAHHLDTGKTIQVTHNPNDQTYPSGRDNKVVWQDWVEGHYGIVLGELPDTCMLPHDQSPCDAITPYELAQTVTSWFSSQLSIGDLMETIRLWKNA